MPYHRFTVENRTNDFQLGADFDFKAWDLVFNDLLLFSEEHAQYLIGQPKKPLCLLYNSRFLVGAFRVSRWYTSLELSATCFKHQPLDMYETCLTIDSLIKVYQQSQWQLTTETRQLAQSKLWIK